MKYCKSANQQTSRFLNSFNASGSFAKSIVSELKDTVLTKVFKNIKEEKGLGISAVDEQGNAIQIGSYKVAAHLTLSNMHTIYVVKNDKLIATLDLEDEIKTNAKQLIEDLHKSGITSILLSGDNKIK